MKKLWVMILIGCIAFLGARVSTGDDLDAGITEPASDNVTVFPEDVVDASPQPRPATPPTQEDTLTNLFRWYYGAAKDRDLFWIVTASLSLLVFALNRVIGHLRPAHGKQAKRVVLVLTAIVGSLGVSYGAGLPWGTDVVLIALGHAAGAAFALWDLPRDLLGLSGQRPKSPIPS